MFFQAYYIFVDDFKTDSLFISMFAFTVGWVITGNMFFQDGFIPHEFTNYGTFHLHFFQPLIGYTIRWHYLEKVPEQIPLDMYLSVIPYLLAWLIPFAVINYALKDYYKRQKICTSEDFLFDRTIRKGTFAHKLYYMFGERFATLINTLIILPYFTFHFLCCMISYKYYWFNTIYIILDFLMCLYNGASFYFGRYQKMNAHLVDHLS